jgi:hypothetical protein
MFRPRKHRVSSMPAYSGAMVRLENLTYIGLRSFAIWSTLFRLIAYTCLYYISP